MTQARAVVYTRNGGPEVLSSSSGRCRSPAPARCGCGSTAPGSTRPTGSRARAATPARRSTRRRCPARTAPACRRGRRRRRGRAGTGVRVWVWEAAYQRPHGTAQEYARGAGAPGRPAAGRARRSTSAPRSGIPFLTAHRCLTVTEDGPHRLGPGTLQGRTVLVAGGAGAVGNAAIQLARWSDATVITTVSSPRKAQLAAAAGADHVIDYRQQDVVARDPQDRPARRRHDRRGRAGGQRRRSTPR